MTATRYWLPLAFTLLSLLHASQAWSTGQQELLLFPSAGPTYHDYTPDDGLQRYEFFLDADILYSYVDGRFRVLGEYLVSTDETELERLQLGWETGQHSIGWIGRLHTPSRYWNITYHHGQYLQTSISRPVIEQFEDDGGILPTHTAGLLFETAHDLDGSAALHAAFSFGAAPVINHDTLTPFDLLEPDADSGAAVDMRLAYFSDQLEENQAGLLLGWSDLEVDGNPEAEQQGLRRVNQYTIGAYVDWRREDWRFISSLASVINRMDRRARNQTDSFLSGYLQAEYTFAPDWTLFGRLEATSNANSSDYLALFPHVITDRQMLGLRFDFVASQALTVEISHAESASDDFEQVLLQWSAVFP